MQWPPKNAYTQDQANQNRKIQEAADRKSVTDSWLREIDRVNKQNSKTSWWQTPKKTKYWWE